MSVQLDAIEAEIAERKQDIKFLRMLERLERNKDFKALIREEYLTRRTLNQVGHLSNDMGRAEIPIDEIHNTLMGASYLGKFLKQIYADGRLAEAGLAESEAALEVIIDEDIEGEY